MPTCPPQRRSAETIAARVEQDVVVVPGGDCQLVQYLGIGRCRHVRRYRCNHHHLISLFSESALGSLGDGYVSSGRAVAVGVEWKILL